MISERAQILQWWALMMKHFSQTCNTTEALVSAALAHQVPEQEESTSVWDQPMQNNEQLFVLHSHKTKSHNKQILKDFQ